MPNEMKYGNVDWPAATGAAGERLATAGEYTGQHQGTPMQDALDGADNAAYLRARQTIRLGTLAPDAGDTNFPDQLVTVPYTAAGAVTEISLPGVTYNSETDAFENVPSQTESFTFKDGETSKTAANTDGEWEVT